MMQPAATPDKVYEAFVKRIVETDAVWGLTKDETWATSNSAEDAENEVILFWSTQEGAAACSEDEWENYVTEKISLVEFLENWCVGMYGDGLLLGADWGADLSGKEAEPLAVAYDVIKELKANNKKLDFEQYESQDEFEEQVVEALDQE
ncbi:DUF2750 domain-containing protein [Pontibacter sp. CAU 1760]